MTEQDKKSDCKEKSQFLSVFSAGDGDLTLRKQSGGLFLVKSGAIYDCDPTDVLPCKTETLNLWVQVALVLQQ